MEIITKAIFDPSPPIFISTYDRLHHISSILSDHSGKQFFLPTQEIYSFLDLSLLGFSTLAKFKDYIMEEEAKIENYVFIDEGKSMIPVSEEKAAAGDDPVAIVKGTHIWETFIYFPPSLSE